MANEFNGIGALFGATVPDVFADDAVGFEVINGTVRITLGSVGRSEPIPPSDPVMAVIVRLVLPIESAQRLSLGLYDFLQKQGLDPSQIVSGGETAQ